MASSAITDILPDIVEMLEGEERLDGVAEKLYDLGEPYSNDALRGVWLGHQVHPMLTDVTLGMFVSAMALDVFGGKKSRQAAQRLVGLGLLSSLGTVVTGLADYSTGGFYGKFHRVAVVHAAGNGLATCLFYRSWRARRRGRHVSGMIWGILGAAALTFAGYLGGHMSFGSNRPKKDENDDATTVEEVAEEVIDDVADAVEEAIEAVADAVEDD